jgi:MoxR-like ATPase
VDQFQMNVDVVEGDETVRGWIIVAQWRGDAASGSGSRWIPEPEAIIAWSDAISTDAAADASLDDHSQCLHLQGALDLVAASAVPPPEATTSSSYVVTESGAAAVRRVTATCVLSSAPVRLVGPAGCGKTALIQHVAESLGIAHVECLAMGDTTDAASLLGGLVPGGAPGTFVWRDGPLTHALRRPSVWLVLEDAHLAPGDVFGVLAPLLDDRANRSLPLPDRNEVIEVSTDFRIFACCNNTTGKWTMGKSWVTVEMAPQEPAELLAVVEGAVSRRLTAEARLLVTHVVERFMVGGSAYEPPEGIGRAPCLRDVIKLAQRPETTENDAHDLFHGSFTSFTSSRDPLTLDHGSPAPTTRSLIASVLRAVDCGEPLLLVGDTGVGKTSLIQTAAQARGQRDTLAVINLSVHTDGTDLLGGFKPLDVSAASRRLVAMYEEAFCRRVSRSANAAFLDAVHRAMAGRKYAKLLRILRKGLSAVPTLSTEEPDVMEALDAFDAQVQHRSLFFAHVDGPLAAAASQGRWILLDEINMASAEALQAISTILTNVERPVHPNFRIFGAMNPPGDVGKKHLPPGLRSRFTELYVAPLVNRTDLHAIVAAYAPPLASSLVDLYLKVREEAIAGALVDGAGVIPLVTLRSLIRTLEGTRLLTEAAGFTRALCESLRLGFSTNLCDESRARFARHVKTDEPLPAALLERLEAAANADSGFRTMEFLASAVVDMELHLRSSPLGGPADVEAAEKAILDEWGLPEEVVMRHRTPAFAHVFSGEGYAAGYYSYLWADTLVADAAEAFDEQGFYDRDLSRRYHELVLSKGHSIEPDAAFRALRGRDPDVAALLRERGLVEA